MKFSPYILVRDSDRREVTKRIENRLDDWASAWLPEAAPIRANGLTVINNAAELAKVFMTLREHRIVDAGSSRVACVKASSTRKFVNLLLGAAGDAAAVCLTDIETDLLDAALEDLAAGVIGTDVKGNGNGGGFDADQKFLGYLRPGAAAVCCEFAVADVSLSLLLSPEALRCFWSRAAATPAEGNMASVRTALAGLEQSKVRVKARLAPAEMTIGDLASLNIGDVIRLSTRIDEHITVHVDDSPVTLHANLGLAAGARALQIVGITSD